MNTYRSFGVVPGVGGGGAGQLSFGDSGPLTAGNVTATQGQWTAYGPPVSALAEAGHTLELVISAQRHGLESGTVIFNARTMVGGNPVNWWTHSNPGPDGGFPGWYVESNRFTTPSTPEFYTVQNADLDGGVVTVQVYVWGDGGNPTVRANTAFRGRVVLKNLGAPYGL